MDKPELGAFEMETKTIRSGIIETIAEKSLTIFILSLCAIVTFFVVFPGSTGFLSWYFW